MYGSSPFQNQLFSWFSAVSVNHVLIRMQGKVICPIFVIVAHLFQCLDGEVLVSVHCVSFSFVGISTGFPVGSLRT